ncbi:MAG: HK97 gp10 family phage protein [Flavobacteriaceae bacterium]|uniref:HK97-gp10 family putative phage morphogenesis protein n=1 Tax=Flagellimonas sp. SN16 TaxID=3415142 RepID=UPI003C67E774|nr:HK97 gp10 family phage protein [Flavobacteriaceae bacterium]
MESVKGLKKLLSTLEKIPKKLDGDVSAIVEANAQEIELEAKREAPKDTGYLARTIATSVPISDKGTNKSRVITANAPYAVHVEYGEPIGTGPNGGPKPFLFPAFFKGRKRFLKDLENLLDNTFDKI